MPLYLNGVSVVFCGQNRRELGIIAQFGGLFRDCRPTAVRHCAPHQFITAHRGDDPEAITLRALFSTNPLT
jgi:hypothetical protein